MMRTFWLAVLCGIALGSLGPLARGDTFGIGRDQFSIDFVIVGNAGNGHDLGAGGGQCWSPYGGVAYSYRISKYEISHDMIDKAANLGLANVPAGPWPEDWPVTEISWYEAAAFVNWLNTSQGFSPAYRLTYLGTWRLNLWSPLEQASTGVDGGTNPYRHRDAVYFLPSEDEWYKAAYHKNDGVTANYWDYPTGGNDVPDGIDFPGDCDFDAVFWQGCNQGVPNRITDVGRCPSPYGTYGQGGNVWEWTESAWDGVNDFSYEERAIRGGGWFYAEDYMRSSARIRNAWNRGFASSGFRIASIVPEPPVIVAAAATPVILWPPNNKMVPVAVSALVDGGLGSSTWALYAVECNAPHSPEDIQFLDAHTVCLRATRGGDIEGRTYTLWLRATDEVGNEGEPVSLLVTVPHDQRGH